MAEAAVFTRAFNEAGDVGEEQAVVAAGVVVFNDADLGVERREGIGGGAGAGVGEFGGEGGFAGVGETDEADVGNAFEDEAVGAAFAGLAGVGVLGGAVGGGFEVEVAPAAVAAAAEDDALAVCEDFGDRFAGGLVDDLRAQGQAEDGGAAFASVAIGTLAVLAALGVPVGFVFVVNEVVGVHVAEEHDVAAAPAVASVGAAPRFVFFAAEADAAASAVTGLGFDGAFVDEHGA